MLSIVEYHDRLNSHAGIAISPAVYFRSRKDKHIVWSSRHAEWDFVLSNACSTDFRCFVNYAVS